MTTPLLLDTCAALWMTQDQPLSDVAVSELDRAFDLNQTIFICPISIWEVGLQMAKGRMTVATSTQRWYENLSATPGIAFSDLSPLVLLASTQLPAFDNRDPADRIIIATAREYGLRIVTRDRKILDYADKGHVLALAC